MANEVNIKFSRAATVAGQTIGGVDELVPADWQAVYRQTVTTGHTFQLNFAVTADNVLASAFHSTQNVDIYTNDVPGGSPTQHIPLVKNVALLFSANQIDSGGAAPTLTNDVTVFYIVNNSGSDAVVQIGVAAAQMRAIT